MLTLDEPLCFILKIRPIPPLDELGIFNKDSLGIFFGELSCDRRGNVRKMRPRVSSKACEFENLKPVWLSNLNQNESMRS